MTAYSLFMANAGKYERTASTRAKNGAVHRGRKLTAEVIAARTATRRANGTYEIHGKHGSPTYYSWSGMIQRCTNPRNTAWDRYGGRGITVCDRWRGSFAAFLSDMGERPEGKTLDRVDNGGPYEPGNCCWSTPREQQMNRRRAEYYDRPPRVPACGHSARAHKARGMCGACYQTWRLALAVADQKGSLV